MQRRLRGLILFTLTLMLIGLVTQSFWLGLIGSIATLLITGLIIERSLQPVLTQFLSPRRWRFLVGCLGVLAAVYGLIQLSPLRVAYGWLFAQNWERIAILGSILGAVGQILIAILAVYVGWEQYIVSKALTIQSNTITEQQTIDTYFEGIAQLMLDEHGLLEDFPMERAIAEGRTAAILTSVNAEGKAKILRFLSYAGLLTPLKRDRRLGKAILNGQGGYAEDRQHGLCVIDLGVILAGADLSSTDLRWTDLSDINLVRTHFNGCSLAHANLSRTILREASFIGADLSQVRLFYGSLETATPRSRADFPDYKTGAFTGAVVEGADFTDVQNLSEAQRIYCCTWGGSKTRSTIPGGCEGIVDRLEGNSATIQQTPH
ncbi:pentapeptide repeat-containing protein [Egbenema bharatensis]|uniref:pentapeptide repeat-containing protein n=1 Tax=Egbenema bharatensis TaxID=3463334 RepID=UPI003A8790CB